MLIFVDGSLKERYDGTSSGLIIVMNANCFKVNLNLSILFFQFEHYYINKFYEIT